jgi:hypothetical protein
LIFAPDTLSAIDASILKSSGPADHLSYRTTPEGIEALEHIDVLTTLLMPAANSQDKLVVLEGL